MTWAIPLILGGLSFLSNKMGSKEPQAKQFPTLAPEQQAFQNKILEMLSGQLGEGNEDFETFASPFRREFNEKTLPGIAERFAGLGGLSSSGFTQSLGQAGAALNEKLAALQSGLKQRKFESLLPFAFKSRFNTGIEPGGQNWLAELLGPIMAGFGSSFGQNLGNMNFGG